MSDARAPAWRMPNANVLKLWLFAIIIGVIGAYAVWGFRIAIDAVSLIAFGATEASLVTGAERLSFWRAWAAPVCGGLVVSLLLFLAHRANWLERGRGQGISDVIEARAVRQGRIGFRTGLAAATISAISLGSGASAGREGPAVHLGATIASGIDRHFGFGAKARRTLLGCGAAAAVAASFNAPIAGVLFALEVILGNYALSVFGPIAGASVAAAIVTRLHLGDSPAFDVPVYGDVRHLDVPLAALLGALCGFVATAFLILAETLTDFVRALADRAGFAYLLLPPVAGLFVGFLGAFHPEIFGVGYEAVTKALAGEYSLRLLIVLAALKIAATAVTISCRFGGGVFSPGLFIGAFVGAAYGGALALVFPDATASPVYYAMIGMGAVGGAILGAPISTTLIVFELTGDYTITIALMVAVAIATLITQGLCGQSFFHWQLSRRGYDLSEGPQGVILKTIRVRDVMEKASPGAPLEKDAARLFAGQSLGEALALLEEAGEYGLPVVERSQDEAEAGKPIGFLSRIKALAAFNDALIDDQIEHHR